MPAGKKTTTERPMPSARASAAHEPEPAPEKQADGAADGRKLTGQVLPGKEHQTPSAAAVARTQAIERAANALRPPPKADARNTCAAGLARRTT